MPKAWVSGQERNEVVVGDLLNLIGVVEIYHGLLCESGSCANFLINFASKN